MSSPPKSKGDERPRFFDSKTKSKCWANADVVPGRHPERWRQDAAGNVVCKRFCNCQGCLCFEYDHIVPFSKGGESTEENCQILQTRVNRFKSDKDKIDTDKLKGYSCDVKFTDGNIHHITRYVNERQKTKEVRQGFTLSGKADRLATSSLCDLQRV